MSTQRRFTEQDSIQTGIPLELLKKWELVMDILWNFFIAYSKKEESVKIKSENNLIKFQLGDGNKFEIGVNIVNHKYLSLFIKISGNDEFEATINNIEQFSNDGIIRNVANIITYAENVKMKSLKK